MGNVLDHGSKFAELLIATHIPRVLSIYWLLAAGSVIVTALPVPVPQAFKDAVYLSACRGKLWSGKPAALGPLKDWCLPQAWFLHFYMLGLCSNAAVLAAYCLSDALDTVTSVKPALGLLLFQFHLVRRALETRFLLHYPAGAVMHGVAYLFGMSYYVAVSLSLLPDSWYHQRQWRHVAWQSEATPRLDINELLHLLTPVQVLGAAVFLCGNALQAWAHCSLATLSRGRPPHSHKSTYRIPKGGLFEYASCPHYLAEIIIYSGLCLVTAGQLQPLLILLWVVVNLTLAAGATHKWYRRHFKAYPPARKALVPYLY